MNKLTKAINPPLHFSNVTSLKPELVKNHQQNMANLSTVSIEPVQSIMDNTNQPNTGSQASIVSTPQQNVRLSKRRWAILFAMALFGFTSFFTSETGPILRTMLDLLELPLKNYVYISQLFNYLPALTTLPSAWFIDRYGIRVTMYLATVVMVVKNTTRALLFNPDLPGWKRFKIAYWIISSMAASQILVTFCCIPLKVSENWFAESERSFAWTVMMSSMSVGISIAAFSLPRFIHSVLDVKPLFYIYNATTVVTAIVILAFVRKSKPTYPPSERMVKSRASTIPYLSSLKKMLTNFNMMIHLIHEAIYEGLFYSSVIVIQDILSASGHSDIFVGNLISFNAISGVVMLIILSSFVHRMKDTEAVCKIASLMRTLTFSAHLATMVYPTPGWIIMLVSVFFNLSRSWSSPNLNNMTAHLASGVVSEATIAGVSVSITVITVSLSQIGFVQLIKYVNQKPDYTNSIIFASVTSLINSLIYCLFFRAKVQAASETN